MKKIFFHDVHFSMTDNNLVVPGRNRADPFVPVLYFPVRSNVPRLLYWNPLPFQQPVWNGLQEMRQQNASAHGQQWHFQFCFHKCDIVLGILFKRGEPMKSARSSAFHRIRFEQTRSLLPA